MASRAEDDAQPDGDAGSITELLNDWQRDGDHEVFAKLVNLARPTVDATAAALLHRAGCRSKATADEVTSLVLDHLRRLPGVSGADKPVTCFSCGADADHQAGTRYVVWLTQVRTKDSLRTRRRRARQSPTAREVRPCHGSPCPEGDGRQQAAARNAAERHDAIYEAVDALDANGRALISMLLAGMTQTAIAASLGVCEGTVSRRRFRAITQLKTIVAGRPQLPR
ncbi:MAG: sigma-70 family RNA polymerase sigma factor [Planctomycetota bacterium]|nr:MAG: sigma-70 family RNA polymerase sigma factor [Planctomycetota bacterium]